MYCFIDAETNDLYGEFLSVAALATDDCGKTITIYHKKAIFAEDSCNDWGREFVLPELRQVLVVSGDLLEDFFSFCQIYVRETTVILDVPFSVEVGLFTALV